MVSKFMKIKVGYKILLGGVLLLILSFVLLLSDSGENGANIGAGILSLFAFMIIGISPVVLATEYRGKARIILGIMAVIVWSVFSLMFIEPIVNIPEEFEQLETEFAAERADIYNNLPFQTVAPNDIISADSPQSTTPIVANGFAGYNATTNNNGSFYLAQFTPSKDHEDTDICYSPLSQYNVSDLEVTSCTHIGETETGESIFFAETSVGQRAAFLARGDSTIVISSPEMNEERATAIINSLQDISIEDGTKIHIFNPSVFTEE